jgi:hypothetical protein
MSNQPPMSTAELGDPAAWALPDSGTCSAALQLLFDVSPAFLANHCVRSYLFARELAAAKGLRSDVDYDDELVFLACILHDLGLTGYGDGDQRFEVQGADAAVRFLHAQGLADERARTVWQSIALHTSIGLAERFGPEQSISFFGISLDISGSEKGSLSTGFAERVIGAWPRHDLGYVIADTIARGVGANPMKGPPFSFPAHLHELINGGSLTFFDVVSNSGWGDQPVESAR